MKKKDLIEFYSIHKLKIFPLFLDCPAIHHRAFLR